MSHFKFESTIYEVVGENDFVDSKGTVFIKGKKNNGEEKLIKKSSIIKPTQEEIMAYNKELSERKSKTFNQKKCNLPKSNSIYNFKMIDVQSSHFSKMKVPGVLWQFVNNCILTDAKSLELFQFNAFGKSAFQDNFYSIYDINVSYCIEGANHYVCFNSTSNSINSFISWLDSARSSRPELTQYINDYAIELYEIHRKQEEIKKLREARGYELVHVLPGHVFLGPSVGRRLEIPSALLSMPSVPNWALTSYGGLSEENARRHAQNSFGIDRTPMFSIIKKRTPRLR